MIDKYDDIFSAYKEYIEQHSVYAPRVVKAYTNTTTYFPIVSCILTDNRDTDYSSIDKIEYYESFYFTIDIYTKDKTVGSTKVASQIISDEITKLTIEFFSKLNMKRTLNQPTPNLDTGVLRRTIRYQCLIGNARANIIRR